jgi:beta-lactamase class A
MNHTSVRRALLLALASSPFVHSVRAQDSAGAPAARLAALEQESGGRLGVAAFNTADGRQLLMMRRVRYGKEDLVANSPISEKHVADGMTVAELCAAALQYSDNSAVNLLMKILGGPAAVTAYARSIGDTQFQLDRWETELNSCIPGDLRDTTTPLAMATSLNKLVLGDGLPGPQRQQLKDWMLGNTTGATRIRAGVPAAWQVADKTGAGSYGTVNDIALLWPPGKAPIAVAIYLTLPGQAAKWRNDILSSVAGVVAGALA